VDDNQYVEAGTLLAQIDPRDYEVAVEKAQADYADAQASAEAARTAVPILSTTTGSQLSNTRAGVAEAQAGVEAARRDVDAAHARLDLTRAQLQEARANNTKAAKDLERMKQLIAKDEISQQQYDAAVAIAEATRAAVASAEAAVAEAESKDRIADKRLDQARARLEQAQGDVRSAQTAPQQVAAARSRAAAAEARVQQAKAILDQAQLNLDYATVRAPVSGIISKKTVEIGQVVQPGEPLLATVPLNDIWVTANFKETQLQHMRPGQPAVISVDAYGGRKYRGHVDSIAAATGARFSLLPPENATGNYVKVVQRVPVKIVFEKGQDPEHLLRPGMSVVPTVITR
jgi:membrane fusion protein (multidrug efflux system)